MQSHVITRTIQLVRLGLRVVLSSIVLNKIYMLCYFTHSQTIDKLSVSFVLMSDTVDIIFEDLKLVLKFLDHFSVSGIFFVIFTLSTGFSTTSLFLTRCSKRTIAVWWLLWSTMHRFLHSEQSHFIQDSESTVQTSASKTAFLSFCIITLFECKILTTKLIFACSMPSIYSSKFHIKWSMFCKVTVVAFAATILFEKGFVQVSWGVQEKSFLHFIFFCASQRPLSQL